MDAYSRIGPNTLSDIHSYRLGVLPDVLDSGSALAKTIAAIVINHEVYAILDVEVEKVSRVHHLLCVHRVGPTEDHCRESALLQVALLGLWNSARDPVAMDPLVVVGPQEYCLCLRIAKLHVRAHLFKCPEYLQFEEAANGRL